MATADDLMFHAALSQAATEVEETLDSLLPKPGETVADAMRYATLSGGKRLRAFLVMESAILFNVPRANALRVAAAAECIHAYSLVHDDLPAMDDDDLRRGKPTVHRKWDEATAVLAGDALQSFAFEILTHARTWPDPTVRLKLVHSLAQAIGAAGMVGGQAMDIAAETAATPLDMDAVTRLQAMKTGALIQWCLDAGPVIRQKDTGLLRRYATDIGLAFQIQDDILDVTSTADATGKQTGKDQAAGKATFVSLMGLDGARRKAEALVASACDTLAPFGSAADNLRRAARYVITRDH